MGFVPVGAVIQFSSMIDARLRRLRIAGVIGLLILLGYLSSWSSGPSCEAKIARQIVPRDKQFFVRHDEADAERLAVWNGIGANYRIHNPEKDGPEHFPWCSVQKPRIWFPFLVSVEYSWVRAAQVGAGGNLWFLCFFGLSLELGHSSTRAS